MSMGGALAHRWRLRSCRSFTAKSWHCFLPRFMLPHTPSSLRCFPRCSATRRRPKSASLRACHLMGWCSATLTTYTRRHALCGRIGPQSCARQTAWDRGGGGSGAETVLWTLNDSPETQGNIATELARHGARRDQVRFAGHELIWQHLHRHALADLFLDNLEYNGGTTGLDALWAGVPILSAPAGEVLGPLRCIIQSRVWGSSVSSRRVMGVTTSKSRSSWPRARLCLPRYAAGSVHESRGLRSLIPLPLRNASRRSCACNGRCLCARRTGRVLRTVGWEGRAREAARKTRAR